MFCFFDTSAIVPLLLEEPNSEVATRLWHQATERYAWQWLRVETEAALVRRKASGASWESWRGLEQAVHWVEPEEGWMKHLRLFNRGIGLRAGDAGHLFIMEQCLAHQPTLRFVTLDQELQRAAATRGIFCLPEAA
jgi:predicted nucleic acid-binding protein